MYAALVTLTIDPEQAPAAARAFSDSILPEITALDGFLEGYWVDPENEEGFGFILFGLMEEAQQVFTENFDWSAPGVEVTGVDVRRVAVSVP